MTDSDAHDGVEAEDYFRHNPPPSSLSAHKSSAAAFIKDHSAAGRRLVLVTSGGTTVPLENQTVRFIDNFSAGTRGATSAEYFLDEGYAVVFLHRRFSLLPYSRHYSHSTNCFLDFMAENADGTVIVKDEYQEDMKRVLRKWTSVKANNLLLLLPFVTVTDYLWSLREIAMLMRPLGSSALFYLAAAVSDFFIPTDRLAEHKIQSTNSITPGDDGPGGSSDKDVSSKKGYSGQQLVINLDPVPKFLKRLVDRWAPDSMIVSFKLETDPSLLLSKSHTALDRYSHHLVIGNLLSTRSSEVVFVQRDEPEKWLRIPPAEQRKPSVSSPMLTRVTSETGTAAAPPLRRDIESLIIPEVTKLHQKLIVGSGGGRQG